MGEMSQLVIHPEVITGLGDPLDWKGFLFIYKRIRAAAKSREFTGRLTVGRKEMGEGRRCRKRRAKG